VNNSRATDPATSAAAGRAIETSGAASNQRTLCLAAVMREPGRTSAELAAELGVDRYTPSRRLPELRQSGKVRNGAARVCNVTGNRSLTWYPVRPSAPLRQRSIFDVGGVV